MTCKRRALLPEQVLASEVLLLRGPSGVHQTLFFQTIREHSHHISKLFPTCIRKSNFLTCEWGVSTGLIHMVPKKSTPTLIFQVTVMHHMQKKNNFPPFFSSPKSLLHQVGAEGQQLEARERQWRQSGDLQPGQGLCKPLPAPAYPPSTAPSKKQGERRSRPGALAAMFGAHHEHGLHYQCLHRSFLFPFLYYNWKSRAQPGCR